MKNPLRNILFLCVFLLFSASAAAGRIVYSGLDTVFHENDGGGGAAPLVVNIIDWLGADGDMNAPIGWIGFAEMGDWLSDVGYTNLTEIDSTNLDSADLSPYAVIAVATCCNDGDGPGLVAGAANIQAFVDNGGGLYVEAHVLDDEFSWVWVPHADQIGHSGSSNETDNDITVLNIFHPVTEGLTSEDLSGWGASTHSDFSTPEAAGFITLAEQSTGVAVLIVNEAAAPPAPVPAIGPIGLLLMAALILMLSAASLRRIRS